MCKSVYQSKLHRKLLLEKGKTPRYIVYRDEIGKNCTQCRIYHEYDQYALDVSTLDGYCQKCKWCSSGNSFLYRNRKKQEFEELAVERENYIQETGGKECKGCLKFLPYENFNVYLSFDGRESYCRTCRKERTEDEYRKIFNQSEWGKEVNKRNKEAKKARYPWKFRAIEEVAYAIRKGDLIKPKVCSICLSSKQIEGHHDDYSQPLNIRWLCKDCHTEWHNKNTALYSKEPPPGFVFKTNEPKDVSLYKSKFPWRNKAYSAVEKATRKDILIRPKNCSVCSSTNRIEAHHDDYSKPLDVRWLCKECHEKWHTKNEALYSLDIPPGFYPDPTEGEESWDWEGPTMMEKLSKRMKDLELNLTLDEMWGT